MMGAIQDLLGRIRNRNSEAPPQPVPTVEANELQERYAELRAHTWVLGPSGPAIDPREFVLGDAGMKKSLMYSRALALDDEVFDLVKRTQDLNGDAIELDVSAYRNPDTEEEHLAQARQMRADAKVTWAEAEAKKEEADTLRVEASSTRDVEAERPGPASVSATDTAAQALAREQLSGVEPVFSQRDVADIHAHITAENPDKIRTQFGAAEPIFTPRSEVAHEARELIADTVAAGKDGRLVAVAPVLEERQETLRQTVAFLGLNDPALSPDAVTQGDVGTGKTAVYARALQLDSEAARLTGQAHRVYDEGDSSMQMDREDVVPLSAAAENDRREELHREYAELTHAAQAKTDEARALRTEASRTGEAGGPDDGGNGGSVTLAPHARAGRWDSEIREPADDRDVSAKASIVERAQQVTAEVRQLSESRDVQHRDVPTHVLGPSKEITA